MSMAEVGQLERGASDGERVQNVTDNSLPSYGANVFQAVGGANKVLIFWEDAPDRTQLRLHAVQLESPEKPASIITKPDTEKAPPPPANAKSASDVSVDDTITKVIRHLSLTTIREALATPKVSPTKANDSDSMPGDQATVSKAAGEAESSVGAISGSETDLHGSGSGGIAKIVCASAATVGAGAAAIITSGKSGAGREISPF
jgi:hypothetical protein